MISLDINKFCSNCPNFEADVGKQEIRCLDKMIMCNTTISCVNEQKCKVLYKYIENTHEQNRLIATNDFNGHPVDGFTCSECGFHTEDVRKYEYDEDTGDHEEFEFEFKYCPNCGSKIVCE